MSVDALRDKDCSMFMYTVKTDYVTDSYSLREHLLLQTRIGQAKGISYANPSRFKDGESRELR